jgi:drug/metabolite transporter (DMT)-like permease
MQTKNVDGLATILLLMLCLVWALQQVLVKAVADDMAPVMQLAIRSAISGALIALLLASKGKPLFTADTWKPGLLAGFLFALEFYFIAEGLRFTTASHMVVFLYTTPIFVALFMSWAVPNERLTRRQWSGVLLAFVGLMVAFLYGDDTAANAPNIFLGDVLGILAALSWALTTVVIRLTKLSQAPSQQILFYQVLVGFVMLTALTFIGGQTEYQLTTPLLLNIAFQSIVVGLISFITWIWLLRRYVASQLSVFTFLTPVLGVLLGAWLLQEPLEQSFMFGALMVITGMLLVHSEGLMNSWRKRKQGTEMVK